MCRRESLSVSYNLAPLTKFCPWYIVGRLQYYDRRRARSREVIDTYINTITRGYITGESQKLASDSERTRKAAISRVSRKMSMESPVDMAILCQRALPHQSLSHKDSPAATTFRSRPSRGKSESYWDRIPRSRLESRTSLRPRSA